MVSIREQTCSRCPRASPNHQNPPDVLLGRAVAPSCSKKCRCKVPVPLVLSLKPLFLLRRVVSPHEINLSIKPIPYTLINVRFITRYLGSQPSSQSPVPWRVKLGRHMKDNQILIIYFIGEEIRVQRICILFFFWLCWVCTVACGFSRVAHRLTCATACGILDPQPGIKPTSPVLEGRFFPRPPGKSQEFVLFLQPHFSPVLPTTKHMFHPCAIIGFDLGLSYSKPLHMLFPLLGMLVPTSAFSIDCVTEISLSGPSLDFTCYDNLFLTPFSICLT